MWAGVGPLALTRGPPSANVSLCYTATPPAMARATDHAAPTLALSDADFELQSGGSRRARLALQARLVAWGKPVAARLAKMGIDAAPAVDEDGSRVVFEGQPGSARLVLSIEPGRVEVGVELVDARAARARLASPERALELTTAIEMLPEQFTLGVATDEARAPITPASTDEMRAWLDRLEQGGRPLWLGWSVPRDVAVTHAALLDEQLEDALVALAQLYRLVTRAPGEHAPRKARRGEARADDDGRARATSLDEDGRGKRRAGERRREREREGLDGEPEAESEPVQEPAFPRVMRPSFAKAPRPGLRRPLPSRITARAPLEKGTRVRVLEGPFSGKVGVIQELDGKGGARVMLGLLAVRLAVKDLAPCVEGRARPVLSTSHRKPPVPVRS